MRAICDVPLGVIPAVEVANFDAVRTLAHKLGWAYALGIHPMYTPESQASDLDLLAHALKAQADDPRLVAVGEIGLDLFVPALREPAALAKQEAIYRAQLKLARDAGLPVILHVRRSADLLLKHLRQIEVSGGIAHAFNGSFAQANQFLDRGFKLGFGGALTFPQATQLRALAKDLPLSAIVLETDSPDIPPQWLYRTAAERNAGIPQGVNTPSQLPRIAETLAELRGISTEELQAANWHNTMQALPKLKALAAATA